jgi:hypothetical protein
MSHKIKVTDDGYVWCIVTYAAIDRTIEDVNNEIDHLAEGNYKPKN